MKKIVLLFMLAFAANAQAMDRDEMIQYFLDYEDVESISTDVVEKLRFELIASDKKITNANFEEIFGTIFEDYREAYIEANAKAYEVYSDEELKALYDFYESDFGDWYRQAEKDFGPNVRKNMEEAREALSIGISNARRKKRK